MCGYNTHIVKEGGIPEQEKERRRWWQRRRILGGNFEKKKGKKWASGIWALELHKRWC